VLPHIFIGYSARGSVPLYPLTTIPPYYTTPVYTEIKGRERAACFLPCMPHHPTGFLPGSPTTKHHYVYTHYRWHSRRHAATLTPYSACTTMHNDHSGLLICNISSVLFAVFMPPAEQVYLPADIKKPPAFPCGGRG